MSTVPQTHVELWAAYFADRTEDNRNALVMAYMPLARHLAALKNRQTPPSVGRDEFLSACCEGLIRAIERYDPATGVPDVAYLKRAMQYAMLDYQREIDVVNRRCGRTLPESVETDPEELDRICTVDDDDPRDAWSDLPGSGFDLTAAIASLDARHRAVVNLHYRMGLTLESVGNVLGLSREMASLIHREAIYKLKLIAAGRNHVEQGD